MRDSLLVSEIFGPTLQGEGPSAGRRAIFLRLGGCNLTCSWCDTPYSWDWRRFDQEAETRQISLAHLPEQLKGAPLLVVTGGEPMLQGSKLLELITNPDLTANRIEIETNGTRPPLDLYSAQLLGALVSAKLWYNVSPKLSHAGDPYERRIKPEVLRQFVENDHAIFKFVLTGRDALEISELRGFVDRMGIPWDRVWLMPEGQTSDQLNAARVTEIAIDLGCNYSDRLHIRAWGNRRGV